MLGCQQRCLRIALRAMDGKAIEISAQSGNAQREVAQLNASSRCLLGALDDSGKKVAVEAAAADNQNSSGEKKDDNDKGH